jgi:hypothetical protein
MSIRGVLTRGLSVLARVTALLTVLAALRLAWLSRGWPLVHDAPLMHYVAWRILEGAVPYRDVFDMNFPGVYAAHLLLLRTLGPGDAAFRVFDLTALLAIVAGLCVALRASGRWGGLTSGALFALYHLAGGSWLAGQRELLLCVCLAWGAAGVIAAMDSRERARARRLGVAALALGAAVSIKPHAGVLAIPLVAFVWRTHPTPGRARALTAISVGVTLPGLVALAWLARVGGLAAFWDITFGYLIPLYSRLGRNNLLHELIARDYGIGVLIGLAAWAGLGAAALLAARRRVELAVLATGAAYGVIHFWGQGRGWEYHLYPLALFLTALGGAGFGAALARGRRILTLMLVIALAATTGALWAKGQRNVAPAWIDEKLARVDRISAALRPLVQAGGAVQVLDTAEGGIHALLRLGARQPSRFLYDFPFYNDVGHPYVQRLRAELMEALRRRPPAAVAVLEAGWPAGGYERLAVFPELERWLRDNYRLEEEGDGYRLYVAGAPAR